MKIKNYYAFFLTALISLLVQLSFAQIDVNFVINPSFEEHNSCPELMLNYGEKRKLSELEGWYIASRGTPDYLQSCSAHDECGVPENMWGYQVARSGNSYVGIVVAHGGRKGNYREYIQSQLKDTLTKGKTYYAEFYISLAEISSLTTNTIGLFVSKKKIQGHSTRVIGYDTKEVAERNLKTQRIADASNYKFKADTFFRIEDLLEEPVIPQLISNSFTSDTANWVKISGTFIAEGGERYVTIGSFEKTRRKKNQSPNRQKLRMRSAFTRKKHGRNIFLTKLSKTAYFYVDDVLIKPFGDEIDTPKTME